jgi:hypothetical protein
MGNQTRSPINENGGASLHFHLYTLLRTLGMILEVVELK